MRRRLSACLGLGLLFSVTPAAISSPEPIPAWGFDGHRIVCEIAWQNLNSDTRREVVTLLGEDPEYRFFSESCTWADEVRREGSNPTYDGAHFVNADPGDAAITIADHCPQDDPCVLEAIAEFEGVLDSQATPAEKLAALKFLGHFVGDLHQPLHAGYGADLGGNRVTVEYDGDRRTLHSVWDTSLIRSTTSDWRDYALQLHYSIKDIDRTVWESGEPEDWANESFQIVEHQVYEGIEGTGSGAPSLGDEYYAANISIVEQRLKQAGVRLAKLLNDTLGS